MTLKEKFNDYVRLHGYDNIHQVAKAANINLSNLHTNLNSRWGISIKRAFQIANTMGVPVEEILELFYEDEYLRNRLIVKKKQAEQTS